MNDPITTRAAMDVDSSLTEFSRELTESLAFIQRQLIDFGKDSDNGHLFAIIHAFKELLGMQAQPTARMAAYIDMLQQTMAAKDKPSAAPVLLLETSVLLQANRIGEAGLGHNPHVDRMKDWGKTSYEMEIAREAGDLSKRFMALQAAYDLARQACSKSNND